MGSRQSRGSDTSDVPSVPREVVSKVTLVLGVDKKTLEQLIVSLPTWRLNRPELWWTDWIIFYDWNPVTGVNKAYLENFLYCNGIMTATLVKWPPPQTHIKYETQREKMLTGFVYIPAEVCRTEWWLKVDTDAVALDRSAWIDPDWFAPDDAGQLAAYVASSWSYTKTKGGEGDAADWAERLERFGDAALQGTERLNLASRASGRTINVSRMASWVSFYNTVWSRRAAGLFQSHCAPLKLPVPSQDTCCWYLAERAGDRTIVRRRLMKKLAWTNCPRIDKLREKCAEVLSV